MDSPDLEHSEQTAAEPDAGERIAKRLARAGLCSRRDAERWITEGRVAVNGTTLDSPACVVRPGDIVQVDGKVIPEPEPARLWRYHKPSGLVTTARDEKGRATVFERLPPDMPRVISIGRLDLTTEGLLLLTNDGELARFLELPATGWTRRYRVRVFGEVDEKKLADLEKGPTIEGVKYGPIEAALDRIQGRNAWLTVSLKEGKNREIRKVMEALGLQVNRLIRVAYGPFQLGKLEEGAVEEVPKRVVREQVSRFFTGADPAEEAKPKTGGRNGGKAAAKAEGATASAKAPVKAPAKAAKPRDAKAGWAKAEPKAASKVAPGRRGPAKPGPAKPAAGAPSGEGRGTLSLKGGKPKPGGGPQGPKPRGPGGRGGPGKTDGGGRTEGGGRPERARADRRR
ncbi:pseudouridine synthase [Azospirillum rugosum]|uniref:Pseudouridine synthase n=1 Tax=Azospirillum rugosum TaxID=416170 RepID=A0ABS4SM42_9PROT|nr:pseudouridine synthase [Azospirillum rugosum]MBP2292465.1 23S rRNA pseudouridine2605 synthase [Azospirillum rugosum]MDQ0526224.1 23S rRNA pseudouridine2605 synthase [Azospirillum rugosum]